MATKPKTAAKDTDLEAAAAARSSAQQIWQAGLGAFAKAQEEGGRVLSKLVKEGNELQQRGKKIAEEKVAGVSGSVAGMAEGVSRQAAGSWDKLEQIFEERVARALAKMGVPAQQEIAALSQRVDDLSRLVAQLSAQPAPAAAPVAATSRTVAKPTAAKTKVGPVKAAAKLKVTSAATKPAPKTKVAPAPAKPAAKIEVAAAAAKPATNTKLAPAAAKPAAKTKPAAVNAATAVKAKAAPSKAAAALAKSPSAKPAAAKRASKT